MVPCPLARLETLLEPFRFLLSEIDANENEDHHNGESPYPKSQRGEEKTPSILRKIRHDVFFT